MTNGNAFFLMELMNLIKEKGYTLEISPKTTNVIKARLAEIPESENEVLECMSLSPEKISIEELELLLPKIDRLTLLQILERLQERHLIKEMLVGWNIYYKFVHRVFREYLYERQSIGKKRMYHEILAEYYEKQAEAKKNFESLPMIIHHYERSHNQVKTYEYKIKYLKEYYTIVNENFPVLHWEIEYGSDEFCITKGAAEMLALAEEVIRLEENSHQAQEMKMEMYYVKGRYKIAVGEYEAGIFCIQKSMELAELLGEEKMLLNNFKQMIFYGIQVEDLKLVEAYVNRGLELLEKEQQPAEEKGVFTRLKGWYLLYRGSYEEAEQTLHKAMELFRASAEEKERLSYGDCCLPWISGRYEENTGRFGGCSCLLSKGSGIGKRKGYHQWYGTVLFRTRTDLLPAGKGSTGRGVSGEGSVLLKASWILLGTGEGRGIYGNAFVE